jgi:hypothetical protein
MDEDRLRPFAALQFLPLFFLVGFGSSLWLLSFLSRLSFQILPAAGCTWSTTFFLIFPWLLISGNRSPGCGPFKGEAQEAAEETDEPAQGKSGKRG